MKTNTISPEQVQDTTQRMNDAIRLVLRAATCHAAVFNPSAMKLTKKGKRAFLMEFVRRYFGVELATVDASCQRLGMSVVSFPEKMRVSFGVDCGGEPCINASVPRIVNCAETTWTDTVSVSSFFKWVKAVTRQAR